MDSNNNVRSGKEIDIRDASSYLLSKAWIIALVTVCAIIVSFLVTSFTTPVYTSTSKVILYNKNASINNTTSGNLSASDFTIATQLTQMSPEIFTGDEFAERVAAILNEDDGAYAKFIGYNDENKTEPKTFKQFFGSDITTAFIKKSISVSSDVDTCSVTLRANTTDARLSAVIVDAANSCLQSHINEIVEADTVRVGTIDNGKIPTGASNIHYVRNMAIGAILGLIAICAILLAFYIFDDKIKTPDDVEKYLGLNVLGEIPEIEEEE